MLFVAPSLKSSPSGVLPSVACSHAPQRVDKAPGTLGPSAPAALAAAAITVAQQRHHQRRKKNHLGEGEGGGCGSRSEGGAAVAAWKAWKCHDGFVQVAGRRCIFLGGKGKKQWFAMGEKVTQLLKGDFFNTQQDFLDSKYYGVSVAWLL